MLDGIKKLLSAKPKKTQSELTQEAINQEGSGVLDDPDFGIIDYDNPLGADEGIWQMSDEWELSKYSENIDFSSSAILGDINGPYKIARDFLISKMDKENRIKLWDMSEEFLKSEVIRWYPRYEQKDLKEILVLTNIATNKIENDEVTHWEVCFHVQPTYINYEIKDPDIMIFLEFIKTECVNVSVDT